MKTKQFWTSIRFLGLFGITTGSVWAQDALSMELYSSAAAHSDPPRVIFHINVDISNLDVNIQCGSFTAQHNGGVRAGNSIELSLIPDEGTWNCNGAVRLEMADGGLGEMPLDFQVNVLPGLEISIDPDTADLESGHLDIQINRAVESLVIDAYGRDARVISSASSRHENIAGGERVPINWTPRNHVILRFLIHAEDAAGFWAEKELFPWFIQVPHENVIFDTNQATLNPAELPKLDEPWERIREAVDLYGSVAPVKLFIGGYTDTVGTRSANQNLSEQRARTLAQWFLNQGFDGEIWYQGFGEDGLAIETGDEVDEAANRRAVYIVAADPPPRSGVTPHSNWRRLR